MLIQVPLHKLVTGMYVESYGEGNFASPLCTLRAVVHEQSQIDALRAEGVQTVTIDPDKSLKKPEAVQPDTKQNPGLAVSAASKSLYRKCLTHVVDVMAKVRQGLAVDFGQSNDAVAALASGMEHDPGGMTLLAKLQRHDDYTLRHCLNVSLLSLIFGRYLGMQGDQLQRLGFAGLYHDLGKFRISLAVLNKPGKLSDREFEVMKRHCVLGYEMLKEQPEISQDILLGVLNHHERFDGKGYHHVTGDKADPFSPILTIVDIFDALTSDRVYHKAKTPHEALKNMFSWRNENFQPGLLEKFVQCFGLYPAASFVRLTDQSYALVVDQNHDTPARPTVKVILTPKLKACLPRLIRLSDLPKDGPDGLDIETCLDPKTLGIALERFY